ncbi:MAG TPA: hypothetical protein VF100_03055, partial [Thermoanaerobaculia bacterium]
AVARLVTGRTDVEARLVERLTVPAEPPPGRRGEEEPEPPPEVVWSLDEALARGAAAGAGEGSAEPAAARGAAAGGAAATDDAASGAAGAGGPAAAGLAEEHRRLILEGMRQVVDHPAGTAHALAAPLARLNAAAPAGVAYRLLAKTGTPSDALETLRRGVTVPAAAAVHRTDYGSFVDSGVLVLAVERTAPGEPPSRLVLTFWIEGQGGSGEAVALAAAMLDPVVRGRWPEDWLEAE